MESINTNPVKVGARHHSPSRRCRGVKRKFQGLHHSNSGKKKMPAYRFSIHVGSFDTLLLMSQPRILKPKRWINNPMAKINGSLFNFTQFSLVGDLKGT
jgi:hypothetical protein